jgi:galactose mutarotase-like enzyme
MFTVDRRIGPIPTLVLSDAEAESHAELAPGRGGMITQLTLGGRELFYLDRTTFEEPVVNVRGGAPVLFPSPGKLNGDAWSWGGKEGTMRQHGFARNLAWTVAATGTEEGAWATVTLEATPVTRAQYPWDFHASYTYRLRGPALSVEMTIENRGASPMPFGAGFHPYFAVPDADKSRVVIPTRATRAFDNREKKEVAFTGLDLTAAEVDMHLLDHGSIGQVGGHPQTPEARLTLDDLTVVLRGSPEFTHWVVWTLHGRDFVCLEPWTCPGNALNTGDRLILLAPGEARRLSLQIARG